MDAAGTIVADDRTGWFLIACEQHILPRAEPAATILLATSASLAGQPACLSSTMAGMSTEPIIFLDHHATTPVDPRVLDAMLPWLSNRPANAGSINHAAGRAAAAALLTARQQLARLIGANPDSVIFTSGGTEANNLAIFGVMSRAPTGRGLLVSAAEHKAVLDPARHLARRSSGVLVQVLPVTRYGDVDQIALVEALERQRPWMVSIIAASNEIGTLNDLVMIGSECRKRGVLFHTDAVQWGGKLPLDVGRLPIDLLTLSGHKMYAPGGIGALYVRPDNSNLIDVRLQPLQFGGSQERGLRPGTVPVALAVAMGAAAEIAGNELAVEPVRLAALRDRLQERLLQTIAGLIVNGHPTNRLPGNLSVSIPEINGRRLLAALTAIAVSSGSACSTGMAEPSHVLRAIGHSDSLAFSSLRFGLGRETTAADVEIAAEHVAEVVNRLR